MAGETSQKQLIEAMVKAKAGDKEAFNLVYQAYYVPVFRYALKRLGGNQAEAEDIAQNVFIKLYRSKGSFTDLHTAPLAYLFTITRNTIIDHWRKIGRLSTVSFETGAYNQVAPQPESETTMSVWEQFKELADTERRVLIMKLVEGFSTIEIAQSLKTSEMNVRQIQCRALKKLRELVSSK